MGLLCRITKANFTLSIIPHVWLGNRVFFKSKSGRCEYRSPKDFRPIRLTSPLMKAVVRLIERYIRDLLNSGHPLNVNQHAYRADPSMDTARLFFELSLLYEDAGTERIHHGSTHDH